MSMTQATQIRLPKIKSGLMKGRTYSEIGHDCGVTLKTIYRDMQVWTQTRDFDEWLDVEWVRLKTKAEQEDFMEVFRQLTKLKAKRITQKIEAFQKSVLEEKKEVTFRLENVLSPEEREFAKRLARKYIKATNTGESTSIH